MRFACLDPAARAAIAILSIASASLWAFLGFNVGHVPIEDFGLAGWAALTCTLSLVAVIIGVVARNSIRGALLDAIMASQPGDAVPLHLVKADQDAG